MELPIVDCQLPIGESVTRTRAGGYKMQGTNGKRPPAWGRGWRGEAWMRGLLVGVFEAGRGLGGGGGGLECGLRISEGFLCFGEGFLEVGEGFFGGGFGADGLGELGFELALAILEGDDLTLGGDVAFVGGGAGLLEIFDFDLEAVAVLFGADGLDLGAVGVAFEFFLFARAAACEKYNGGGEREKGVAGGHEHTSLYALIDLADYRHRSWFGNGLQARGGVGGWGSLPVTLWRIGWGISGGSLSAKDCEGFAARHLQREGI